jgi:hypothetical protein
MKKKETKVLCPGCGTELATANRGFTAVAALTGKNPGLGIVYPEAETQQKQQIKPSWTARERIEALRKAGVDVSNLFAMQGANGGEFIASNKDGNLAILDEHGPVFSYIARQGTVPNRRLFRRFVMAQMFHMMSYVPYGQEQPAGVTHMIRRLGYEYQWKMLMNELYAQMKMEGKDAQNLADRNRWFHTGIVVAMAEDYIEKLKKHIKELPEKRCKGIAYKRIAGRDIFVSDLQAKLYNPFLRAIRQIAQAGNATGLYNAVRQFNEIRIKLASGTPQCNEWMDAYKGAGAFFTMQNLIRFHNCTAIDDAGKYLDKYQSLAFISVKAEMYRNGEGWRLLAVLKKMLDDNNIDIRKKVAEWRRRK